MTRRPRYHNFEAGQQQYADPEDRNWAFGFVAIIRKSKVGSVRPWPDPPPMFTGDDPIITADMLRVVPTFHLVSDTLRALFEIEAPGIAEYLPIRVVGSTGKVPQQRYWMMNWLSVFDCMDLERSRVPTGDGDFLTFPVIMGERIPEDGLIGIVKHEGIMCLVRNDLRLKMIRAGITNTQFTRVHVVWPEDDEEDRTHPMLRKPEGAESSGGTPDPKNDPAEPAPPPKPTSARRAAKPRAAKKHKPDGG